MKKIYLILGFTLFISCKTKITENYKGEIIIANKALSMAIKDFKNINLISQPDNELVSNFKNGGFYDSKQNIYKNKFFYKADKVAYWNKQNILKYNVEGKEVAFIRNISEIPKIGYNDTINAKTYHSISNVMFSDNGNYAIVNITSFSNLPIAQYYEGQMYIFKKEDGEWVYQFTFMTAIS